MTTGDSWRGATGLEFARAMLKIGHPVAVFLNLDAVRLALRTGEQEKKASMPQVPREIIADLIRGGAIVLICQPCLSEFGFKLDDVVGRATRLAGLSREFRLRRQCAHANVVMASRRHATTGPASRRQCGAVARSDRRHGG
jgi:predicted peroxiredoxin